LFRERVTTRRARNIRCVVGAMLVVAAASCTTSTATHSVAPGTSPVSFVEGDALRANGTLPAGRAADICGSDRYGWLAEIAHTGLANAKVSREWAAFVPVAHGLAARQMEASGVITKAAQGTGDVPIDHPYGGDLSFDEHLTPAFAKLDQNLGDTRVGGNLPDTIHDEIPNGLLPHAASAVPARTWPSYAADVEHGVAPGFLPEVGDAVAARGSWVVDCGHVDFHSELHSVSFLAFGRVSGTATVAHAFANPYEVAQVYDPVLARDDALRLTPQQRAASAHDVLRYIPTAVLRLATGADRAVTVPVALQATTGSPTEWLVCAPAGSSGHHLRVSYAFSTRPGVSVQIRPHDDTGCATVTTTMGPGYTPLDPPGQKLCSTPWSWLDRALADQADTVGGLGASTPNLQDDILNQVKALSPELARRIAPKLARGVLALCFPPLRVASMPSPSQAVTMTKRSTTQALPFAGWIRVAWE
jgi:hypothetical protein